MINQGETYDVHDREGRKWGWVRLEHRFRSNLSGYLHPTPEFAAVHRLFLEHEPNAEEAIRKKTGEAIFNLGVVLTSQATNTKHHPFPPVFVSDKLLLTCDETEEEQR